MYDVPLTHLSSFSRVFISFGQGSATFMDTKDCVDFLLCDGSGQPENSKKSLFVTSNSVMSFDGLLSFWDPIEGSRNGGIGPDEIALKHHEPVRNSDGDWKMLNAGWMLADAVLLTANILFCEPNVICVPHFIDMQNYRSSELNKADGPLHVILVSANNYQRLLQEFGSDSPIFQKAHCLIALRLAGFLDSTAASDAVNSLKQHFHAVNIHVKPYGALDDSDHQSVNQHQSAIFFRQLFDDLYIRYKVHRLEINAGGKVLAILVELGLLDEMRMTVSGQLVGSFNGRGERRPSLFPSNRHWAATNNPHLIFKRLKQFGQQLVFYRCQLIYRHV
jgi:riboflavin biosynthesis pyrimidine reductase